MPLNQRFCEIQKITQPIQCQGTAPGKRKPAPEVDDNDDEEEAQWLDSDEEAKPK